MKSAQVYKYIKHSAEYGINIGGEITFDFSKAIERSRNVAEQMSKGIQFLFKKNKIEHIQGFGKLIPTYQDKTVEVTDKQGNKINYTANHIILSTGARPGELPNLKLDHKKVIGYREALTLSEQPKSMVVVGSGAIGTELAYFYNAIGTKVTLVELLPNIVPLEDEEVSRQLGRSLKKAGIKVMTKSTVKSIDIIGNSCNVETMHQNVETRQASSLHQADIVLSAVGIKPNLEKIGIEELEIELENGKIKVDDFYRTNIEGIYAIGDIIPTPALAHVASAEGIVCVEKIAGKEPRPVNYNNIPSCIYTSPEVASTGLTELAAQEAGFDIKIGKFPFTASGKASAAGERDGFVKLIFDAKNNELLGAHLIGANVTEMIAELVVARNLKITAQDLIKSVHPHPTMSEAVMEAAAAAYGEVIHI